MPELVSPLAARSVVVSEGRPPWPVEDRGEPGSAVVDVPGGPLERYSPEEFLRFEMDALERHEFYDGKIYAMPGGRRTHAVIIMNVARNLGNQLQDRPCDVYGSDMRLKVSATGLYTYPDVMVACGEPRVENVPVPAGPQAETLLNPQVVIEVLSRSTQAYDRGAKFEHVRQVESVTDYLLVAQDARHVESRSRQPDGSWERTEFAGEDAVVPLPSVGCELPLAAVYRRIPIA